MRTNGLSTIKGCRKLSFAGADHRTNGSDILNVAGLQQLKTYATQTYLYVGFELFLHSIDD